jgi:hypothetical protein
MPAPGYYDDGEIGGIIGRETRSTRRKPAPVPDCPPQTPHDAWTRTRAAAVGSQRLRHGLKWYTYSLDFYSGYIHEQYIKFSNQIFDRVNKIIRIGERWSVT